MDLVSSEVSKVNVIFVGRDPVKMGFDLTLRNNEAAWKLYYVCIFRIYSPLFQNNLIVENYIKKH